jgi:hypothetical protein
MTMVDRSIKVGPITARISKSLLGLRRDLVSLSRAVQRLAVTQREIARHNSSGGPGRRTAMRRRSLTPEDRARLKVQGEYLGLVRHLSGPARRRVKSLKATKGYGPALRLARQLSQGH